MLNQPRLGFGAIVKVIIEVASRFNESLIRWPYWLCLGPVSLPYKQGFHLVLGLVLQPLKCPGLERVHVKNFRELLPFIHLAIAYAAPPAI